MIYKYVGLNWTLGSDMLWELGNPRPRLFFMASPETERTMLGGRLRLKMDKSYAHERLKIRFVTGPCDCVYWAWKKIH